MVAPGVQGEAYTLWYAVDNTQRYFFREYPVKTYSGVRGTYSGGARYMLWGMIPGMYSGGTRYLLWGTRYLLTVARCIFWEYPIYTLGYVENILLGTRYVLWGIRYAL